MIRIVEASSLQEYAQAGVVLGGFPDHQRMRYASKIEIVERYFDNDAYTYEMAHLDEVYTQAGGCVLLALEDDEPVGGVCLKKMDEEYCEMKRLFVPIVHRQKGIGGKLAFGLLNAARAKGFTRMRLDTGTFMLESHQLYEKMGFKRIDAYYEVKDGLQDGLYFMELNL